MVSVNIVLVAIISIISVLGLKNSQLVEKLIHNPYKVVRGQEYYRLLSSGFIHANFMHLFFNMYVMYTFGGYIESVFQNHFDLSGVYIYILLFISGVVIANIPDLKTKKDQPYYNSLGASGGVSSIVFASILLNPLSELTIFPIPIPIPAWIFAILYLLYSLYAERKMAGNINHMAHIWGGIWGFVFTLTIIPSSLSDFFQMIIGSL